MSGQKKQKYSKPGIIHREKVEALAQACDSAWNPRKICQLQGDATCQKTR